MKIVTIRIVITVILTVIFMKLKEPQTLKLKLVIK